MSTGLPLFDAVHPMDKNLAYYWRNRTKRLADNKAYREANKERLRLKNLEKKRMYRLENRDKIAAAKREYAKKNRERVKQQKRESYDRRKAERKHERWHLKAKYGIDQARYDAMHAEQGGVCAICCQPERRKMAGGSIMPLSVDHDHATGTVRGLLCADCNSMLGYARDSQATMRAAIAYLSKQADRRVAS